MRILLTGASGFLGGHICELAARQGHAIAGVVRPTSSTAFLKKLGVELRVAALDQPVLLRDAMHDIDVVVHVAAKVHRHGYWRDFAETTIQGTRNVLEAAISRNISHFIQISTVGVYGLPREGFAGYDESFPCGDIYRWNFYVRAKIEAEKLVLAAHAENRIATTVLRPDWIYGPRDDTTLRPIVAALRDGRYKWIGTGENKLSLVHVRDVASAVLAAASQPAAKGQIYNVVAGDPEMTQRRFITRICEKVGLPLPKATVPYGMARRMGFVSECIAHGSGYRICPPITRLSVVLLGGNRRYRGEKLRRELGWQPSVSIEDGLTETLEWYLKHVTP